MSLPQSPGAWKRVTLALRGLSERVVSEQGARTRRSYQRYLGFETLSQRQLMAADYHSPSIDTPITFGYDQAISAATDAGNTTSASSPMAGGEEGTAISNTCDNLEVILALLLGHREDVANEMPSGPPETVEWFEQELAEIDASIASIQADIGTCGSGDGSDGTGGSTDDDTSGSSGGGTDSSSGSGGDTAGSGGSGTNGGTSGSEASGTSGSDGTDFSGTDGTDSSGTGGTNSSGSGSGSGSGGTGSSGTGGTDSSGTGGTDSSGTGGTDSSGTGGTDSSGTGGTDSSGTGGTDSSGTGSSGTDASGSGDVNYAVVDLWTDGTAYFWEGSGTGTAPTPVREGDYLYISGNVQGPGYQPGGGSQSAPVLTLHLDWNYDGDFDDPEDEQIVVPYSYSDSLARFEQAVLVSDDGPSPGDGVPTNNLQIKAKLADSSQQAAAEILNVAPALTTGVTLQMQTDANLDQTATLSSPDFFDPGSVDEHTLSVTWGDGVTTPGTVGAATSRLYPMSPGSLQPVIYPVTIKIADDDTGKGQYRMEKMTVGLNGDDDDDNNSPDRDDAPGTTAEDDLDELNLEDIIANRPESDGSIFLKYNYIAGNNPSGQYPTIRLWADSSKTTLAGTWDPCFGLELPDGVTSVWVEGTEYGEDTIQVWWEPEEVSNGERPSVYQGKQIALGSVVVEVAQPPWGTLKIEESYWGTPNKWFRTDDDNILWRHNSHQASFKTPADYDLSKISSFKVYTISDEDVAGVAFPKSPQQVPNTIYNSVISAGAVLVGATAQNNKVPISLPDGKHNVFGIFVVTVDSQDIIYLTNVLAKAAIGVQEIKWFGITPDDDPFGDDNFFADPAIVFPGAGLSGNLILPESNAPSADNTYAPRTEVDAIAILTIPVPAGMSATLHAKVLDPDHFGTGDFDPNEVVPGGDNILGTLNKVADPPRSIGVSGDRFEFQFEAGDAVDASTVTIVAPQPGNNWMIGVHDRKMVVDDLDTSSTTGTNVVRDHNNQEFPIDAENESVILTAGRTLWVELDTMDDPPAAPTGADDETFVKTPLDISLLRELMSQALVRVQELPFEFDLKDNIPFKQYFATDGGIAAAHAVRDVESEQYFWVVQTIDAYEHAEGLDNDDLGPDSQGNQNTRDSGTWFAGYAHVSDGDEANTIYHEVIRDVHAEGQTSDNTPTGLPLVDLATHIRILVAHESLHRFLGYHTGSENENAVQNSFLMNIESQFNESLAVLSDRQLRVIQNQKLPR